VASCLALIAVASPSRETAVALSPAPPFVPILRKPDSVCGSKDRPAEKAAFVRRFVLSIALALALCAGPSAQAAFAWANGPDFGDGFGTHDWVLDEALRLAGTDGEWVDYEEAMLATDDPDNLGRLDYLNHIYNLTRTGCGAPQRVGDLYYEAVTAYAQGDRVTASRALGELSHYYADICQPYHTVWDPSDVRVPIEHLRYELAVDDYHRHSGNASSWIAERSREPVDDARAATVRAARAARADYASLKAAVRESSHSAASGAITRRRLSRAANDLADMIAAIPAGEGLAAEATISALAPSTKTPRRTSKVAARATLLDESGEPLEGVRIDYTWRIGTRSVHTVCYSDKSGIATSWQSMVGAKAGKRVTITARAVSNGVLTTRSTSVTPK
jgi:hypothetical protein